MATVVNRHYEEYDIYIGRGTKWGNPFVVYSKDPEEREFVIKEYEKYLWEQIKAGNITLDELIALDGKRLACSCKPRSCHGDILVKAITWAKKRRGQ